MKLPGLVIFISLINLILGNTLYDLNTGNVYIHLTNNDVVMLNFSIDGKTVNIEDDQQITSLNSPPQGTDLFLFNHTLYGFNEVDDRMNLIQYDNTSNVWNSIDLDFDDINDDGFYNYSNYLTSPASEQLFIYGGENSKTGDASNRLLSLNFTNFKLANISTSTKPQSFYGASNVLAPSPQTQLLIGGQSDAGWLNMYQLATWDFTSGWASIEIDQNNSTVVNSRKSPNLLPIFGPLDNNSDSTITNDYKVTQLMIIGGVDNDGNLASPPTAMLTMDSNNWYFQSLPDFNVTDYLGFATIFNNFITISESADSKTKRSGSSNDYQLNLFDLNFTKVKELTVPKSSSQIIEQNEKAKHSTQMKAILGTVLPVSSLIIILTVVYFIMKKKKKAQLKQELKDLNYQYENYFNIENEKERELERQKELNRGTEHLNLLYNDSNSTLDANSIDSWVRKRQEFDSSRIKENPFMQSQETLNEEGKELTPEERRDSSDPRSPEPLKTITKLNRSMLKLRKSISFNNMSPSKTYSHSLLPEDFESKIENQGSVPSSPLKPVIKSDISKGDLSKLENQYNDLDFSDESNHKIEAFDDEYESDDESDFNQSVANMDVQVLVSSKRRTMLKIMNPDLESIEEASLRQRVPSNESQID